MKYVVREGTKRGEGRYLDGRDEWGSPERAWVYGTLASESGLAQAKRDAAAFGGRVVPLTTRREREERARKQREDWKARAEKAERELASLQDSTGHNEMVARLRAAESRLAALQPKPLTDEGCDRLVVVVKSAYQHAAGDVDDWYRAAVRAVLEAAGRYVAPEPVPLTDEDALRLHGVFFANYRVGPGGSPTAEVDAVRALLREAGRYALPKVVTREQFAAFASALHDALVDVDRVHLTPNGGHAIACRALSTLGIEVKP